MKIKVSEATNIQLNWLVAKIKGIPTDLPKPLTYEDAKDLAVPFTLYGRAVTVGKKVEWHTEKITVLRCGIDFGCIAPSISFFDSRGRECRGSISDFHLTEEAAQMDAKVAELGTWKDYDFCDWPDGGPILYAEKIGVGPRPEGTVWPEPWLAASQEDDAMYWGPTPPVAGMRCYVASELGDEVEVPDNLEENL